MERVLILGATGNLGGLVAGRLAGAGHVTLRLASSREEGLAILHDRFPAAGLVRADWYDGASLVEALKGVDRIFIATPDFVTDETVAMANVVDAVRKAGGISQIVRLIAIPPGLNSADLSSATLDTRIGAALHTVAKPILDASALPVTYINVACWIMFNLPWFMAEDVRNNRRVSMPAASDAPRRWIAEGDIADVAAKILTDKAVDHVGAEYLMTGAERIDFRGVASLLSDATQTEIRYHDDDRVLRAIMGEAYDTLMTYFTHEVRDYRDVPFNDARRQVTGVRQTTLAEYIHENLELFA